ncbi:MAG: FMN-binding negative transcriptional regulator [Pseudomonadota bacterium]
MFTPSRFAMPPKDAEAFMRTYDFAALVVSVGGQLEATHVPVRYQANADRESRFGSIVGHLAGANPLCSLLPTADEVLCIFSGPHGYISPTWYASAPAVPTWNFQAVHAYGTATTFTDPERLYSLLEELSDYHEASNPTPWRLDDVDRAFLQPMLRAIVGFEIAVERVDAKEKLSQNRSPEDRAKVTERVSAMDPMLGEAMLKALQGE